MIHGSVRDAVELAAAFESAHEAVALLCAAADAMASLVTAGPAPPDG